MELTNELSVPLPPERAWEVDPPQVTGAAGAAVPLALPEVAAVLAPAYQAVASRAPDPAPPATGRARDRRAALAARLAPVTLAGALVAVAVLRRRRR